MRLTFGAGTGRNDHISDRNSRCHPLEICSRIGAKKDVDMGSVHVEGHIPRIMEAAAA